MPAQIRPNRLTVSDRFPMLGFTIRTDGAPQRAEVTLATSPELFADSAQRTASNFFSTRELGPLSIPGPEAVYVVPPQILARFIGGKRLYFALAMAPVDEASSFEVVVMPSTDSPYISIAGLTGRSMRQIRMFPHRQTQRSAGDAYDGAGSARLTWAGDASHHGGTDTSSSPSVPVRAPAGAPEVAPTNGYGDDPQPPQPHLAPVDYDDGFGPLPATDTAATDMPVTSEGGNTELVATAEALDIGDIVLGSERRSLPSPGATNMSSAMRFIVEAALLTTPALAALREIANRTGVSIGVGPKLGAGVFAGGALGAGIIFAPNSQLGVYGSAQVDAGFLASLSATAQVTVLSGGISSFNGMSYALNVSGGEGVVVGLAAIFDANSQFLGVSFELGVGAGSPFEVFMSVQGQVSTQLGYAAAFGTTSPRVHAMIIGPDDVEQAQRYAPAWQDLFNWTAPAAVAADVQSRGMSVQRIQDAAGELNLDKYEVRCTSLPNGYSAASLLNHIRQNMNQFVDTNNTEFNPYSAADASKWSGSSPLGAVFNLDIVGPDNAAVVGSMVEANRFRFTTIETPDTGSHPVSGHREFGYREEDGSVVFYTRGADRATHGIASTIVFAGADHLWKSFQRKLKTFIDTHGGAASSLPRFSERFHPDVVRILYGNASAQSLGGGGHDPLAVEIKYRMFIPSPVIEGPPLMSDYGGDGRGFSYSSGSSRGEIRATVHLSSGMGIERIALHDRHWGESTKYDKDDTYHVAGKPDWWLDKRSNADPTERGTLAADDDNLRIYPGTSGQRGIRVATENASAVTVEASGGIPFSRLAPNIDADVSILFRNRNGLIQAKALGDHDGFPAHELYVNGEPIHRYDPVAAGKGPTSLAPPSDMSVDTPWVTVARTYTVRTGPQALNAGTSSTINWDEVQLVPQPTDHSCWAAAAAMLIGWKERMSLTPEAVANLCGRSTMSSENFTPSDVATFASEMGLQAEAPQSYTAEGLRSVLENNGPLWVVKGTPPTLHAVVVTGMYNSGDETFVRISDPWDRAVGTPGAPGNYADTHATGSRYIMRWADFAAEYEAAATGENGVVNLQIMHAGGTDNRQPNRGESTPKGYAQSAALSFNESFTINWDELELIPQPTDLSCWATTAAMVIGWRDRMSLSPQTVASIGGRSIHKGLDPSKVGDFAADMGLVAEPPQSYSPQGFRDLVESSGPLWVGAAVPSLHVIAVTGIYNEGDQLFVRVTDPWDRAVGTPGAPGPARSTHHTGSRYIMRWEDFAAEYEAAAANFASVNLQILHSGGVGDRQPNRGQQVPPGYAQALMENGAGHAPQPAAVSAPDANGQPAAPATGSAPVADAVPTSGSVDEAVATPGDARAGTPVTPGAPASPGAPTAPTPSATPARPPANGAPDAAPTPPPLDSEETFPPTGAKVHRARVERNGVTYDLASLEGQVVPLMETEVEPQLVPGERIEVTDWPYIDGPDGQSRGGVVIDWSYGGGSVANVRVTPATGGQALNGYKVIVSSDVGAGPSTRTETKLKVTIRTLFSREGDADQSAVSEVTLCGSGKFETQHRAEAEPVAEPALA